MDYANITEMEALKAAKDLAKESGRCDLAEKLDRMIQAAVSLAIKRGARAKEYYDANKEKIRETQKRYREQHRENFSRYQKNYQARKTIIAREAEAKITPEERLNRTLARLAGPLPPIRQPRDEG